jgi:hypothetical protein
VNKPSQNRFSSYSFHARTCLVAFFLFIAAAPLADARGADAPQVKRVLILHSFGRDFAPFNAASSGFRTELGVLFEDTVKPEITSGYFKVLEGHGLRLKGSLFIIYPAGETAFARC